MTKIEEQTFRDIVDIVYKESGIVLHDKRELVEARIASLCRKKKYKGPEDFLQRLKNDESGQVRIELLDQVSTNLTFFFREEAHFDYLAQVILPELAVTKKAKNSKRIRIWSAACSSGEEPYSLAMVITDFFHDLRAWDIKILATDISTKMLAKAQIGEYSKEDVTKTSPQMIQRHFDRIGDRENSVYRIKEELRSLVVFRRLNLLEQEYPFSGLFDVVVCRNVMIYFDNATKETLLNRFYRYMNKNAYLFTGHAESLSGYEHYFKRVKVAIYKK